MIKAGSPDAWFVAFIVVGAVTACGFGYLAFAAASQGYVISAALFSVVATFAVFCTAVQSCHRG